MSRHIIKASAPASIGNLAVGFDCLGAAVEHPEDVVTVEPAENGGMQLASVSGDDGKLPRDMENNVVGVVARAVANAAGQEPHCRIHLEKGMALNSGLGSSAASSVAAAVAMNAFLGEPFSKKDLLPFCLQGEKAACGAGHADNAAPCLLGGVTLIRSDAELDVISVHTPDSLRIALVHPDIPVPTREARRVIPETLAMSAAIEQWRHLGAFLLALEKENWPLMRRSFKDLVSEPVRRQFIPGFEEAQKAAVKTGAVGCSISGSGPTMFALCENETIAKNAAAAMQSVFTSKGITSQKYVEAISVRGAEII